MNETQVLNILKDILKQEEEIGIKRLTGMLNQIIEINRQWWNRKEVASLLRRKGKGFAEKLPKRYVDSVLNNETYYRWLNNE